MSNDYHVCPDCDAELQTTVVDGYEIWRCVWCPYIESVTPIKDKESKHE